MSMFRVSVWDKGLSERYLRLVTQLGADAIDFGGAPSFPGVREQGYPSPEGVREIKQKIAAWGMEINRVTLPDISAGFMRGAEGSEREIEKSVKAIQVFGEAGITVARQRFWGDVFREQMFRYRSVHRGGYQSRGETRIPPHQAPETPDKEALDYWWSRFCAVYEHLTPAAEKYGVKLAIHPSDTPLPDTPLGGLGYHRVIDAFPSKNVGYLYCCGTRAEAGGSSLVLDEINNYGRKGRIFTVHMRNVRGSLATSGAFEEALLDDGDMNVFKILKELQKVGFSGCINADHIPQLEGDYENLSFGLAYSIGYLKAMFAALAA